MSEAPDTSSWPSLAKVMLASRAFLLSWQQQTLPARSAAIEDAVEHFEELGDDASEGARDHALRSVIGEAMQPLEDLAYLASAWDEPFGGLANYRRPSQLDGPRVLVVGGGNSACDIAVEAATAFGSADISLRRGYWFLPKTVLLGIERLEARRVVAVIEGVDETSDDLRVLGHAALSVPDRLASAIARWCYPM